MRVPVQLAGPADAEVSAALSAAIRRGVDITHHGLVDVPAKAEILSSARVFLLPTQYEHEAQPLVIYEAASAGAVPIAFDVGWIGDQMRRLNLGQYVVPEGDLDSLLAKAEEILTMGDAEFNALSMETMRQLERLRAASASHVDQFRRLLDSRGL